MGMANTHSDTHVVTTDECSNCGAITRVVARPDLGALCLRCWQAEWAYMAQHFAAEEMDSEHRAMVRAAFATGE